MTSSTTAAPLHTIPLTDRPRSLTLRQWFRAIAFFFLFNLGCLCVNGTQFLLLPLRVIPQTHKTYDEGINYTKAAFGTLLVLVTQWFAPTTFVITYEGTEPVERVFERDADGNVVQIRMPDKLVVMSNHQMYADWLYLWCFAYFTRSHDQILIILKKSLKHIPVVGWGMQFFRFIFLARSWAADRIPLGKHLDDVSKRAQREGEALNLIIFPEGTLVSPDTRPLSKKFADKSGIHDLDHTLLPRSTGLLFLLRTIAPAIPSLHLLDVTMGYPGIPPKGYGQHYYTLRSTFIQGIPPPQIHVHLRLYRASDIPFGDVSRADGLGRGAEATPEEAKTFEEWLQEKWREKDRLMDGFYKYGKFETAGTAVVQTEKTGGAKAQQQRTRVQGALEIPVRLRSQKEIVNAFAGFVPVIVTGLGWYLCKRW